MLSMFPALMPKNRRGRPNCPPGLGTLPVGLAQDRHPEPGRLQHPAEDAHRERRVIDVGVARDEDDVDRVPAPRAPSRPRDAGSGGSGSGTSGSTGSCVGATLASACARGAGGWGDRVESRHGAIIVPRWMYSPQPVIIAVSYVRDDKGGSTPMATATQVRHTPEDLLEITDRPMPELIDGQLVERQPMGQKVGRDRCATSFALIGNYVEDASTRRRQWCPGELPDLPRRPREGPHPRCLLHPPGTTPRGGVGGRARQDRSRPGRRGDLAERPGRRRLATKIRDFLDAGVP